jgi:hypothetical protein
VNSAENSSRKTAAKTNFASAGEHGCANSGENNCRQQRRKLIPRAPAGAAAPTAPLSRFAVGGTFHFFSSYSIPIEQPRFCIQKRRMHRKEKNVSSTAPDTSAENSAVNNAENSAVNSAENSAVNNAENSAVISAENSAVNNAENSAVNNAENSAVNSAENATS